MKLNVRLIALSSAVSIALACSTPALADVDCGQILKYGVFEVTSDQGKFASESAFRNFVCNEEASSSSHDADGNYMGWGYGEFAYKDSKSDYYKYCSEETNNISFSSEWNTYKTKASETLANAWVTCIKSQTGVGSPAFALYYLTDPQYVRFEANYRAIKGDKRIPYQLIITPSPKTGDFSCTEDGKKYFDPRSEGYEFMVGPFSSLTCKRRIESQTYDVDMKPNSKKDVDAPLHSFRVAGRFKPVSKIVTATMEFDALSCTHQHCDKSFYDKMGDSIEAYEGRIIRLEGTDTWTTIELPKKFRDLDIADTEEHNLSCKTSNPQYGQHRLKKVKFTPDGDHVEVYGDTQNLKPDGKGWSYGTHQDQKCTFSFERRIYE